MQKDGKQHLQLKQSSFCEKAGPILCLLYKGKRMLLELQSPYGLLPFQQHVDGNIQTQEEKEWQLNNEALTNMKK